MPKNVDVMILTGGKVPKDLISIFGEIPSGLVPINNRPIIYWIIDQLIRDGYKDLIVCVGFKKNKVKKFVSKNFHNKANIVFAEVDYRKKPGNSLLSGLNYVKKKNLLVILGDTLIRKKLNLNDDTIFVSDEFKIEESYRWALAENERGFLKRILDKERKLSPNDLKKNLNLIIGAYYFVDVNLLKKIAKNFSPEVSIEISTILEEYNKKRPMKLLKTNQWYDVGHLDKYYSAKQKLFRYQTRFFNILNYDGFLGIITKKSKDIEKFKNEIKWYLNLPRDIKAITPRILDFSLGEKPFLTLEYYNYPTLAELYVFGEHTTYIWENIIEKTINVLLKLFYPKKGKVSLDEYYEIYWKKLKKRISQLIQTNKTFRRIFQYDTVFINNKPLKNFKHFENFIKSYIKRLYKKSDNCFIHGDYCFSNILYDIASGIIRVFDPRGKWGKTSYGDIKYDVAKLRHSIIGGYDFIVNNLFDVKYSHNKIDYEVFIGKNYKNVMLYFDEKISKYWNANDIKLIEGLLFLSMLPLHKDHLERQLVMYSIGVERLNEIFSVS